MEHTFFQRLLAVMFAGLVGACLFWTFRHIVAEAIHETSNEGYRDMFQPTPVRRPH